MAKAIKVGASKNGKATTNVRKKVTFTLNGKKVTTAGMLFGGKDPDMTAGTYVRRQLVNLGIIAADAVLDMTVDDAPSR